MRRKKITQAGITSQQGINLIENRVLEMGFLWYPTGGLEAGIDGYIEIRDPDSGEVLNSIVQVQSKATREPFQAETQDGFDYVCEEKDLDYWLQGNAPVILVRSRPSTSEAYWISVKDYFADPITRKSRKVHFDKKRDPFDASCRDQLAQLAIPRDAGIYLAPLPRRERLYSNLLQVASLPECLYLADTDFRLPGTLWARLRELGSRPGGEWIIRSKRLLSYHDLRDLPWSKVCDVGTVEVFHTAEWSETDDPDRLREFVDLLNRCLREKTWGLRLRYDESLEHYYFQATRDLSQLRLPYRSLARASTRTVFQGYPRNDDPEKMAYYRHMAFEGRFRRYEGVWYLEINPTYHFTYDGYRSDVWHEGRLAGIKRLEKNPAVLQQVVFLARYLGGMRAQLPLLEEYSFISFGDLLTFEVDIGIDEVAWLKREEDPEVHQASTILEELPLFDHED